MWSGFFHFAQITWDVVPPKTVIHFFLYNSITYLFTTVFSPPPPLLPPPHTLPFPPFVFELVWHCTIYFFTFWSWWISILSATHSEVYYVYFFLNWISWIIFILFMYCTAGWCVPFSCDICYYSHVHCCLISINIPSV